MDLDCLPHGVSRMKCQLSALAFLRPVNRTGSPRDKSKVPENDDDDNNIKRVILTNFSHNNRSIIVSMINVRHFSGIMITILLLLLLLLLLLPLPLLKRVILERVSTRVVVVMVVVVTQPDRLPTRDRESSA